MDEPQMVAHKGFHGNEIRAARYFGKRNGSFNRGLKLKMEQEQGQEDKEEAEAGMAKQGKELGNQGHRDH
jgi:hypothetical protein